MSGRLSRWFGGRSGRDGRLFGQAQADVDQALDLVRRDDFEAAVALMRPHRAQMGPATLFILGGAEAKLGNTDAAESAYRDADALGHGKAALHLGVILFRRDEDEAAEAAWRRALEHGERDAQGCLGELAEKRGDLDAAEAAYGEADRAGDGIGSLRLGVLLVQRGQRDEAEAAWKRALERGQLGAALNLGRLAEERDEPVVAEALYRGVPDDHESAPAALAQLGVLLQQRGDEPGAESRWRAAAARGNGRAAFNLGVLLERRGDAVGSLAAFADAESKGYFEAMRGPAPPG